MGEYLVTFENVAKHFELRGSLNEKELTDLPQYNYLKSALMKLQDNCVATRKDVDSVTFHVYHWVVKLTKHYRGA